MFLPCPRALYLLLLPLIYLLLQPPQEPVLPTQLGQQSLEKGGQELFMDQIWLFPLPHNLNILSPALGTQQGFDQENLHLSPSFGGRLSPEGDPAEEKEKSWRSHAQTGPYCSSALS